MTDEMIIDLYSAKDDNAITETKTKYGKPLFRICHNILKSSSDAEECESDTYLKTWQSIPPASPKSYFFAFLAKIARNNSLNLYAKQRAKKRSAVMVELSKELEQCIPAKDTMKIQELEFTAYINVFLSKLTDDERNVFVRRYWFCDSISEIATAYSFSNSKVKSMLMRTRDKLKKYMDREEL